MSTRIQRMIVCFPITAISLMVSFSAFFSGRASSFLLGPLSPSGVLLKGFLWLALGCAYLLIPFIAEKYPSVKLSLGVVILIDVICYVLGGA